MSCFFLVVINDPPDLRLFGPECRSAGFLEPVAAGDQHVDHEVVRLQHKEILIITQSRYKKLQHFYRAFLP